MGAVGRIGTCSKIVALPLGWFTSPQDGSKQGSLLGTRLPQVVSAPALGRCFPAQCVPEILLLEVLGSAGPASTRHMPHLIKQCGHLLLVTPLRCLVEGSQLHGDCGHLCHWSGARLQHIPTYC